METETFFTKILISKYTLYNIHMQKIEQSEQQGIEAKFLTASNLGFKLFTGCVDKFTLQKNVWLSPTYL